MVETDKSGTGIEHAFPVKYASEVTISAWPKNITIIIRVFYP